MILVLALDLYTHLYRARFYDLFNQLSYRILATSNLTTHFTQRSGPSMILLEARRQGLLALFHNYQGLDSIHGDCRSSNEC